MVCVSCVCSYKLSTILLLHLPKLHSILIPHLCKLRHGREVSEMWIIGKEIKFVVISTFHLVTDEVTLDDGYITDGQWTNRF